MVINELDNFKVLQYITSQISELISLMRNTYIFSKSDAGGYFAVFGSYFHIFVGLGVGGILLDYLLYCFGVEVPSADEDVQNDSTDYDFLDDDDY